MNFQMSAQPCKFSNFNPRPELHGENAKPAADLHFSANVPNSDLSELHPELKGLLYCFDEHREQDLATQGQAKDEQFLPNLRFPKLGGPLKWKDEVIGAPCTVKYGRMKVRLEDCVVGDLKIDPQEGGTVILAWRVQGHPTEQDAGKLYLMVGQQVEVTIEESRFGDAPPETTE